MPSLIERAIAANRAQLSRHEGVMRKRMTDAYWQAFDAIERELDDYILWAERFPEREFSPFHRARLEQLLADAERVMQQFAAEGQVIVEQAERMAITEGMASAERLTGVMQLESGFRARVPTTALSHLVSATGPESPVRAILDGYAAPVRDAIEQHLVEGMASGKGSRSIIQAIRDRVQVGYSQARLEALVRTETMRAYRGAQLEAYAASGVQHWRWNAAKSRRTCLACLAMDGRIFPITQPFNRAHVSCRCSASPVPDPEIVAPLSDEERAELGIEDGKTWFARQSEDVQREMLPSRASYAAFERGDITLDDFVGERHDPVWGPSIYERSGREVLRDVGGAPTGAGDVDIRNQSVQQVQQRIQTMQQGETLVVADIPGEINADRGPVYLRRAERDHIYENHGKDIRGNETVIVSALRNPAMIYRDPVYEATFNVFGVTDPRHHVVVSVEVESDTGRARIKSARIQRLRGTSSMRRKVIQIIGEDGIVKE